MLFKHKVSTYSVFAYSAITKIAISIKQVVTVKKHKIQNIIVPVSDKLALSRIAKSH